MHDILLIDDDASIRETLPDLLQDEGYKVVTAANGLEALGYLARQRRAPPSLILLDMMMPVMGGLEFLDSYTADPVLPEIPIIVISAQVDREAVVRRDRVVLFLKKPIDLGNLFGAVEEWCTRGTTLPEGLAAPGWGGDLPLPPRTTSVPGSDTMVRADEPHPRKECDRSVLVVEDDDAVREALVEVLKEDGYRVSTAKNGAEAIELLANAPPPCVVLVDLMMPIMTGWELVASMRAQDALATIPVVVTSAAADRSPPGADRVLAKPLSLDLLLTTVGDFCAAPESRQRDDSLRELARRNIQLVELQRFRDEMSALIVHDMKSPLSAILCNLEYVLKGTLSEGDDKRGALVDTQGAAQRLMRLIENLLELVKLESGRFLPSRKSISATDLLRPLFGRRGPVAKERGIRFEASALPSEIVIVDAELVARALDNVLDNAFRYTPRGGVIEVGASTSEGTLSIRIGNSGDPIPEAARARIFEKYGQTGHASGRSNLGLGLYFCRLVMEAHGGTIRLEASPELPTMFVLDLPL